MPLDDLDDHIRHVVADAPQLTGAQQDRLTALLRPRRDEGRLSPAHANSIQTIDAPTARKGGSTQ